MAADDLKPALSALPLFPLHQVVLFPGMLLPLHVFEPRYRALVRDALAGHHSLAVAHLLAPEAELEDRPPLAEVAGVGTIVEHRELPGGRYDIVLLGRGRVRLQELSFEPPYRRALATLLEPPRSEVPAIEVAVMHQAAAAFAALVRQTHPDLTLRLPRHADAGACADSYAHQLLLNPPERQLALELLDARNRVRHVTEVLTLQYATLAPDDGKAPN